MDRAGELPAAAALMGWLAFILLAAAVFAAMVLLRVPRMLWSLAGAALMLAGAGYAIQGSPGLEGRPTTAGQRALASDPGLIDLRTQMFGRFGEDGAYLVAADALARSGSSRFEVEAILGGIRRHPRSGQLWTALGDALARHDGQLSAPAKFAFDQARRLEPRHPGPPFFLGLAQVRANDFAAAATSWRRALALSPADAPYRDGIAQRLELLERLRQVVEGGPT